MSKRIGGTIEGWTKREVINSKTYGDCYIILGYIFGDDYWPDGIDLRTSKVVEQGEDYIETLNTIYKLGTPGELNEKA